MQEFMPQAIEFAQKHTFLTIAGLLSFHGTFYLF